MKNLKYMALIASFAAISLFAMMPYGPVEGKIEDINPMSQQPYVPYWKQMYNRSPVLGAVILRDADKVQEALSQNFDPNIPDEKGRTPLLVLFVNSLVDPTTDLQIAELLLKAGADPEIKSTGGDHPNENVIDAVRAMGNRRALELLQKYGYGIPEYKEKLL